MCVCDACEAISPLHLTFLVSLHLGFVGGVSPASHGIKFLLQHRITDMCHPITSVFCVHVRSGYQTLVFLAQHALCQWNQISSPAYMLTVLVLPKEA